MKLLLIFAILFLAAGCTTANSIIPPPVNSQVETKPEATKSELITQTINFTQLNSIYKFSSTIPSTWKAEYLPALESINIYDPSLPGNSLQQSQIFIRYFKGSKFLTLTTVDIFKRESLILNGRDAVRYEIKKKANIPNFPNQPPWRNEQHMVTDIRYSKENPSTFYVLAKNPSLSEEIFNQFINNLAFH